MEVLVYSSAIINQADRKLNSCRNVMSIMYTPLLRFTHLH